MSSDVTASVLGSLFIRSGASEMRSVLHCILCMTEHTAEARADLALRLEPGLLVQC